jgi:hypothetical protein
MRDVQMTRRTTVAEEMVRMWGDDYLMRRSAADVANSYGLPPMEARRILDDERRTRGLL